MDHTEKIQRLAPGQQIRFVMREGDFFITSAKTSGGRVYGPALVLVRKHADGGMIVTEPKKKNRRSAEKDMRK